MHHNPDCQCHLCLCRHIGKQDCLLRRYRKALKGIAAICNNSDGGDWDEIEEARTIANKALEK